MDISNFQERIVEFINAVSMKGKNSTLYPFISLENNEISVSTIVVERNEITTEDLNSIFLSVRKILRVVKCPIGSFLNGEMVIEDISLENIRQLNNVIGQFNINRSITFDENDSEPYDIEFVNGLYEIVKNYKSGKSIEAKEPFKRAYKFLFFDKYNELYRTVYPQTFAQLKI